MAGEKAALTTKELKAALYEKYCSERGPAQPYALLEEVRSETGYSGHSRYADALVMSLWPSRGLELIGIEIKASRTDWLKELEHPEKSEPIFRYCDRWYLVVGSESIVKPGELPSTWGLMAPRGQKLVTKVEAPVLSPQPISRGFLAAIFRSAYKVTDIKPQLDKARGDGFDNGYKRGKDEGARLASSAAQTLLEFQEASGIDLDKGWQAGKIGDAVKRVLAGDHLQLEGQLRWKRQALERLIKSIDEILEPKGNDGDPK